MNKWFAWHPVKCVCGTWVWWKSVNRWRHFMDGCYEYSKESEKHSWDNEILAKQAQTAIANEIRKGIK